MIVMRVARVLAREADLEYLRRVGRARNGECSLHRRGIDFFGYGLLQRQLHEERLACGYVFFCVKVSRILAQ